MPDESGKLYLFEAIELRNDFDRRIKLLEHLVEKDQTKNERLFRHSDEEEKQPVADFDVKELEKALEGIQLKRVKLNQAIQKANFAYQVQQNGQELSLAEALELRKKLLSDIEMLSYRIRNAAYKRVIHKEERDIVYEPKFGFIESYENFYDSLINLRQLVNQIHIVNHRAVVDFREE